MPKPRSIDTSKRGTMLDKMTEKFTFELKRLDAIITDLEKDHVDDAAKAKSLLKSAKAARKNLAATVAAL